MVYELIPKSKKQLLELNHMEDVEDQVVCKFIGRGGYEFYAISGVPNGDDLDMFGYCISPISPEFNEFGYASMSELEECGVILDDTFKKTSVRKIIK